MEPKLKREVKLKSEIDAENAGKQPPETPPWPVFLAAGICLAAAVTGAWYLMSRDPYANVRVEAVGNIYYRDGDEIEVRNREPVFRYPDNSIDPPDVFRPGDRCAILPNGMVEVVDVNGKEVLLRYAAPDHYGAFGRACPTETLFFAGKVEASLMISRYSERRARERRQAKTLSRHYQTSASEPECR